MASSTIVKNKTLLDQKRIHELATKIRMYDPAFDTKKVITALKWARSRQKHQRIATINDVFSDPLLIAEQLVDLVRADGQTILASILYPSVRPVDGNKLDNEGLVWIKNSRDFGEPIYKLVCRTLKLRSLNHLKLRPGASQSERDQISLFNLMSLWMAEDPRAIAIRVVQRIVNMQDIVQNNIDLPLDERDEIIHQARNVAAPLAYIAGYSEARRVLLNLAYRIENPVGYAHTQRTLGTVDDRKLSDDQLEEVKRVLSTQLYESCGLAEGTYTIEIRRKSPSSAAEKAERKKMGIENLGDKFGFRIILKAHDAADNPINTGSLDAKEKGKLLKELGDKAHQVYARLSKKFGRGNRKLEGKFQELLARKYDPERLAINPNDDGYFDDYINHPKESGYSAIQDAFFIRVGDQIIEFEGQIVDEIRHDVNTYGPRAGHVYYKSGMADHVDKVQEWRNHALQVLRGHDPEPSTIGVFDDYNQIFLFNHGHTIADFSRRIHDSVEVVQATVENGDPFLALANPVGPGRPLNNADRVTVELRLAA
jgi:(p)ppGpp synthase/HD superfamily hydrolase